MLRTGRGHRHRLRDRATDEESESTSTTDSATLIARRYVLPSQRSTTLAGRRRRAHAVRSRRNGGRGSSELGQPERFSSSVRRTAVLSFSSSAISGPGRGIQCGRVIIRFSPMSVRWTGHLSAISRRRWRCSSLSGPPRLTIRSMRSILHGGALAVDCLAHGSGRVSTRPTRARVAIPCGRRRAEASLPCTRRATRAEGRRAWARGRHPPLPARRR